MTRANASKSNGTARPIKTKKDYSGAATLIEQMAGEPARETAAEKRLQFFLFPAERDPKDAKPLEFSGWRYVEQEGWTGAVRVREGVCFMAALRGSREELAPYLAKHQAEASPHGSPR